MFIIATQQFILLLLILLDLSAQSEIEATLEIFLHQKQTLVRVGCGCQRRNSIISVVAANRSKNGLDDREARADRLLLISSVHLPSPGRSLARVETGAAFIVNT